MDKLCVSCVCVSKLCVSKLCVRKLCVCGQVVCVSRREEAELCVSKLCVRKLCVDKLCVSRWEEAEGEAEEEGGSAGVPNQKQEPHTKMWGKMQQFCETSSILVSLRQSQKRKNSARLLQCFKLTTSKTKQLCETSFSNGKLNAELTASYQCVLQFFHSVCERPDLLTSLMNMLLVLCEMHLCKILFQCPTPAIVCGNARSYEVLHLSRKIILANLQI